MLLHICVSTNALKKIKKTCWEIKKCIIGCMLVSLNPFL